MSVSRRRVLQGGALAITATLVGWPPVVSPIESPLLPLPDVGDLVVRQYGALIGVTDLAVAENPAIGEIARDRLYRAFEKWIAETPQARLVGEPKDSHSRAGDQHLDPLAQVDYYGIKWAAEVRVTPEICAQMERDLAAA